MLISGCASAHGRCFTPEPLTAKRERSALPYSSSPSMTAGTDPSKKSATTSHHGPDSVLSACSPVASKLPSCGWRSKAISSPNATGSTSLSPCPTFCGPFSTTTGPCSMCGFGKPPAPCYGEPANRTLRSASSAPCTVKADSSTSIRTFTSLLPAGARYQA